MHPSTLWICTSIAAWILTHTVAVAQDDFDAPPISYSTAEPDDIVANLQRRLDTGELALTYDDERGYLPALLEALGVPAESQLLVFSKTSLQRERISPRTPRAIYFNDDVYVGFCQNGRVLEISAVDPQLGAVFYTLDQRESEHPTLRRQTENCLSCHSTSRTGSVPGHLVRSLFVDAGGLPLLSKGSHAVNHTTPLKDRWGGWYVTGTHGAQSHMGNLITRDTDEGEETAEVDNAAGQNVTRLDQLVRLDPYLTSHSDIVALMVMEHQTLVHNRLTHANYAARQALDYEATMNRALEKPEGTRLESTTRRIASAGDALVDALLLVNEAQLTAPIQGTSGFTETFARNGPQDAQGRSLRDLDLGSRLFQYPCSYLIYSRSFDELPAEMREYVWQQLWNVVSGVDTTEKFAHLSIEDRQAIREILRDTKPGLPAYWN